MKYLIALFLLVSPGFACEHRSSFLHKTPDFKLLFWGLSSQCPAPYIRPLIFGFSNRVSGTGGRMFNA